MDPVAVSSGWTYEKSMIMTLIRENKLTDPLTRKSFNRDMIYQNCCVEHSVKWFTKMNPEIVFMLDKKDIEI